MRTCQCGGEHEATRTQLGARGHILWRRAVALVVLYDLVLEKLVAGKVGSPRQRRANHVGREALVECPKAFLARDCTNAVKEAAVLYLMHAAILD